MHTYILWIDKNLITIVPLYTIPGSRNRIDTRKNKNRSGIISKHENNDIHLLCRIAPSGSPCIHFLSLLLHHHLCCCYCWSDHSLFRMSFGCCCCCCCCCCCDDYPSSERYIHYHECCRSTLVDFLAPQ